MRIPLVIQATLSCLASALLACLVQADQPQPIQSFLSIHCSDCHSGPDAEAALDLEQLSTDLTDGETTQRWTRIFDRVRAGEMPPPDDAVLDHDEAQEFLKNTEHWIASTQQAQQQAVGRVRARRLTNTQLERTLQDLFGIDIPLEREMPEAPRTGSFSTLAEQQSISHFALEQHLKVVDLALDEAFRRGLTPDDRWQREMTAKQISRTRPRTREPEYIDGSAVTWSSRLAFYGRLPATTAKESGWYRFRFQVSALKKPEQHGVWCSVQSGACVSSAPLMSWIDSFEAQEQPREITVEAWLPAGHMLEIRPGDVTLKAAKFAGGQSANGEGGRQNVPGIKIDWLVMERIHHGADDATIRRILFGDSEISSEYLKAAPTSALAANPLVQNSKSLLRDFAHRAFRREVSETDMLAFDEMFARTLQEEGNAVTALRAAYRAILCSARFLYFQEYPGPLDDYAIASRLSYLLWGTMPDAELFQLAAAGQLRNEAMLRKQLQRMLADPKGQRFVADFAGEWLELNDIDFTEPDPRMFREFDPIVQTAMLDETQRFLQFLLDENMSVVKLVDSDFTFANSRLARYYDIPDVFGDDLQRVALRPEFHRGGLLAQGAILKVTANGTNTSPVLRGVWLANRVFGQTIPPPPDSVPAIEPDIRGTTTIREQLAKHRDHDACAACHTKIDPPGFALENFDPAGQWRTNYPRLGSSKKGAEIDASYVTADGQPFEDFAAFKRLSAADPIPLARNLASQLLTYGTGAKISFADRQTVDAIVQQTSRDDYGFRSILEAVVTSDTFLTK